MFGFTAGLLGLFGLFGLLGRLPGLLGLFVFLDVLGQVLGAVGQLALFVGESFRGVASGGSSLESLLLFDDPVYAFEVFSDPGFFGFEPASPIFAQKQFQERLQILLDLLLLLDGLG